ncbi:hypothetical protein SDJN02_25238, partial [Cucurbita argyrosperma subsp. argyrosperma]
MADHFGYKFMEMNNTSHHSTDKPKNNATPVMNRFLIEFINDNPTEAEKEILINKHSISRDTQNDSHCDINSPTRPNKTQ